MIPLALLFSVTVLYLQGKSANLLSIGAVDFGIIVDSSVIIVENIYRHITAHDADRTRPLIDRITDASHEIERALFFSTTIIVCAFIPLFSMTGPEGALFGPMANTYAFAICGALILAVTLAPVLCSFLFHNKKEETDTFVDRIMKRALPARAEPGPEAPLADPGGDGSACWSSRRTLVPGLGGEFMPQLEEGNLWIRALLPRTVSLEDAARMAPRLREVIASVPEVRGVMSHVGRPDDGTDVTSFFNLEFNAPLKPMEQWRTRPVKLFGREVWRRTITREEIQDELMEKFREFPGDQLQLLAAHPRQRRGGALGRQGGQLGQALRHRPEGAGGGRPARRRRPRDRSGGSRTSACSTSSASRTWRSRSTVANAPATGSTSPTSRRSSRWRSAAGRSRRWSRGRSSTTSSCGCRLELRDDPDVIDRIPVDTPPAADGQPGVRIPLAQLAKIYPHKPGASYIYRENNRRFIPIKFSVRDRDLASAIAEAQRKVERPQDRGQAAGGLQDRVVGRVRADAGGQRPADVDRARCRSG